MPPQSNKTKGAHQHRVCLRLETPESTVPHNSIGNTSHRGLQFHFFYFWELNPQLLWKEGHTCGRKCTLVGSGKPSKHALKYACEHALQEFGQTGSGAALFSLCMDPHKTVHRCGVVKSVQSKRPV